MRNGKEKQVDLGFVLFCSSLSEKDTRKKIIKQGGGEEDTQQQHKVSLSLSLSHESL